MFITMVLCFYNVQYKIIHKIKSQVNAGKIVTACKLKMFTVIE